MFIGKENQVQIFKVQTVLFGILNVLQAVLWAFKKIFDIENLNESLWT